MKDRPINLILPNTTNQKMDAIVSISKAIENISIALTSIHTDITLSNNKISDCSTAIYIETEK